MKYIVYKWQHILFVIFFTLKPAVVFHGNQVVSLPSTASFHGISKSVSKYRCRLANVNKIMLLCAMRFSITLFMAFCFLGLVGTAQLSLLEKPRWQPVAAYETLGRAFLLKSAYSMFPDTGRSNGHVYNGNTYPAFQHYNDSSIFVFVPNYFTTTKPYDVVIWFHGWYSNIDSSLKRLQLVNQFFDARRNAIFVFPEGPKNAPDSYGGKWEDPANTFSAIGDVVFMLEEERILPTMKANQYAARLKHITLAGHSGAYKVIAKNQRYAKEILLFDGLYGSMDAYLSFSKDSINAKRLVHIYTEDGGTKENSLLMMKQLDSLHIPYLHREEEEITLRELAANRIVFLHSKLGHNDVITNRRNFERLLATKE